MQELTFRPTLRQSATALVVAAVPMAGGIYALTGRKWYAGGAVWTAPVSCRRRTATARPGISTAST